MEWNPVLEHRLQAARQAAGWRWVGYPAVALGMLGLLAATPLAAEAQLREIPSWWLFVPGAIFFVSGMLIALPAEKSARVARELAVQKQASSSD